MKNFIKIHWDAMNLVGKVLAIVGSLGVIVLIILTMFCNNMRKDLSSFFGGWVGSLIISALFCCITVESLKKIKPQIPTMVVDTLAKKHSATVSLNYELVKNEAASRYNKAEAIAQVFTETDRCVDDYYNKWLELNISSDDPYKPTWLQFASFNSPIPVKCKRKSEYEELKKDFKKDIEIIIYKDLFDNESNSNRTEAQ